MILAFNHHLGSHNYELHFPPPGLVKIEHVFIGTEHTLTISGRVPHCCTGQPPMRQIYLVGHSASRGMQDTLEVVSTYTEVLLFPCSGSNRA